MGSSFFYPGNLNVIIPVMFKKSPLVWLIICGVVFFGFSLTALSIPSIRDRLTYEMVNIKAKIHYSLNPPEEVIFIPQPSNTPTLPAAETTKTFYTEEPVSPASLNPPAPRPTRSPTQPVTPTVSQTPVPKAVKLSGIRHEYQKWNNCGPANLSMALSYWGWKGDQSKTAAFLKPNQQDKNVMPYEMANFVEQQTKFRVFVRVGGDLNLIKQFIAAGFPVIVEKGFEGAGFSGWMGHYGVISGYDDNRSQFIIQDSYIMPDLPVSYEDLISHWRAFNNTYILIYPPNREEQVKSILGTAFDEHVNDAEAAQKASDDIYSLYDRDLFFAWFNRGSNLVRLEDYTNAAIAFDTAFSVYANLPAETRPWRMLWYQTSPYFAYYFSGRYYDVINLANQTLDAMSEPILEESYYWRGLAKESLGDLQGALKDLRKSVELNPNFTPGRDQLKRLGE